MIVIADPSKPFEYNAKGNVRRNPILERYSDELDGLYKRVEQNPQLDVARPDTWNAKLTKNFVRAVVQRVLVHPISDDADIFRSGCDR